MNQTCVYCGFSYDPREAGKPGEHGFCSKIHQVLYAEEKAYHLSRESKHCCG